ncbi:hypothetical protein HK099_001117 [Clydaea vesicula]|uniref:Membrane dipeptidase n=1 Tax=Clydaea vesicula TaxID=447962 RepID=A0AAD5U7Q3_9FUNG|nr:hypothetical protein HK099_001117 [Clydaea vesicula]
MLLQVNFFVASTILLNQIYSAPATSPILPGFADLHVHQMAEFAFRRDADIKSNVGTIFGPLIDKEIGPDAGWHLDKRWGIPDNDCDRGKPKWYQSILGLCKVDKTLSGFPRYDTFTHQQVWEGYLKTAHDSGLTLMVMSAVNYKPLCKIMAVTGVDNDPSLECNGMASIKRQFDETKIFCSERDWCQVVFSPEEARTAISAGKMAILLSIELTHIFEDSHEAVGAQVDYWYDQGLRVVQIAHEEDNIFAGVVPTNPIFKFFQAVSAITQVNPAKWPEVGPDGLNKRGLSEKGVRLVNKLMEKGIIIDVAHLSFRSTEDIFQIGVEQNYYPFIQSHGHFGDNDYSEDRYLVDWMSLYFKKSGSVLGSMAWNIFNDYSYSFDIGVNVAFGSDFNGFAHQLGPNQNFQDKELREKGFAHIGLYPGLIKEIKHVTPDQGGNLLHRSTENVVQLWERCLNSKNRTVLGTEGFNPRNKNSASPRRLFNASQILE